MAIKQSTLEKKWYYRVAKVLFLAFPSVVAILIVIYGIQQKNTNLIIYAVIGMAAYLLILKIIWRIFLYIVFGGLDNDVKRGDVKTVQQPDSQVVQPAAVSGLSAISKEDKKQIGFYIALLIILGIIYYAYFIWKPNDLSPQINNGDDHGSKCVSTGCGSLWRCDGTYYDSNGVQRTLHACLPRKAGETYSSWSGTCRQCP